MSMKSLAFCAVIGLAVVFTGCKKDKTESRGDIGDPCTNHADCEGFCYDPGDGSGSYCTDSCVPGDETCPAGYECAEIAGFGFLCIHDDAEKKGLGEDCDDGSECESGFCKAGLCSLCEEDADCAGDATCEEDPDLGYFVCTEEEKAELGEPCTDGAECASGFCKEDVCSQCEEDTDCPGAQICVADEDLGYHICLGGDGELGDACTEGADCASGFCKEDVCSQCEEDTDCAGAEICVEDTDLGYFVCWFEAGELGDACTEGADCASGFCKENVCSQCEEDTDCAGAQACLEDENLGYYVCIGGDGALGDACTEGADCASGFCNADVCSECEGDTDCDGALTCEEDTDLGYYTCQGGDGALGDACTEGADCASGFCKEGVCSECEEDVDCDGALICAEDTDLGYYTCQGGDGALGTMCSDGADCASGYCYDTGWGTSLCSECEVDGDCGDDEVCEMDVGDTYATCKLVGDLGSTCTEDADCLLGYCYERVGPFDDVCSECKVDGDCTGNQTCNYSWADGYAGCG